MMEPKTIREECEEAIAAALAEHDGLPTLAQRRLELAIWAIDASIDDLASQSVDSILNVLPRLRQIKERMKALK